MRNLVFAALLFSTVNGAPLLGCFVAPTASSKSAVVTVFLEGDATYGGAESMRAMVGDYMLKNYARTGFSGDACSVNVEGTSVISGGLNVDFIFHADDVGSANTNAAMFATVVQNDAQRFLNYLNHHGAEGVTDISVVKFTRRRRSLLNSKAERQTPELASEGQT